jgi:hypothetical protein
VNIKLYLKNSGAFFRLPLADEKTALYALIRPLRSRIPLQSLARPAGCQKSEIRWGRTRGTITAQREHSLKINSEKHAA